jgi:hypothetical protein
MCDVTPLVLLFKYSLFFQFGICISGFESESESDLLYDCGFPPISSVRLGDKPLETHDQ